MNKKGFTLIELLAVITLIAIIAVIAVPNVVKMVDGSKREMFVNDAKDMISKARYMNKLDKYNDLFTADGSCKIITLNNLGIDIEKDPDGNTYSLTDSKVKVCVENSTAIYYVKTMSKDNEGFYTRGVLDTTKNFIKEADLTKNSINQIN